MPRITSIAETWSSNGVTARKINGCVSVMMAPVYTTFAENSTWYSIATLPDGWRPYTNIQIPSCRTDGSGATGIALIQTNGLVRMFSPTADKGYNAEASYVV